MTIPSWLIGLGLLALGLVFTFVAPPGRRAQWAFLDELAVFLMFVFASFFLWPLPSDSNNVLEGWNWLLPGIIAGGLALFIIEFRRWKRYFQNLTYRMRHPYYWYSRLHGGYSRRRRRRY